MGFLAIKDSHLVLLLLCIALVPWPLQHVHSQDLSYLKLISDAKEFTPEKDYDYIVVGGGTAGCPLAATLSLNHSVLLLEWGGSMHANPNVVNEDRYINNVLEPDVNDSPAQTFPTEDGISNMRGRVLGGTSMIGFGFYSRADQDFYNVSGIKWDKKLVKSAYEWVEEVAAFRPDHINSWQTSAKDAMLQSNVGPDNGFSLDHIVGAKITASSFDSNGRRHGPVQLLNKANPNNLKVLVHATVERVIFSTSKSSDVSAVGVIYHDSNGNRYQVLVGNKGEVILSAGVLGSTQLVLLSGVGPRSYLSSLNISVVRDNPSVGHEIADNPRVSASFIAPNGVPNAGVRVIGITNKNAYIFPVSGGHVPFFSPVNHILFPYPHGAPLNFSVGTICSKLSRPLSTGSLKLVSPKDVNVSPILRFNYYANKADMAQCTVAARYIGNIYRTSAMEQYKFQDEHGNKHFKFVGKPLPEDLNNNDQMEEFCRTTLATIYHYYGGCSMHKVVDTDFRVIGIHALRIVDGSTFLVSPGTNPVATLMMLGRYVGVKMQEERASN